MELSGAKVIYLDKIYKITYKHDAKQAANHDAEGVTAKFYGSSKHAVWRYKTLFIKEPETIEWLRALGPDDVLWDIGANVGVYTIYAALVTGCRVVAVEPGAANYWTLCKNIEINKLDDKVTALCIALGDEHRCATIYLSNSKPGYAQNALDQPLNDMGQTFVPQFKQGMLSIPADILVGQLGALAPTAIKIDVDGFELPVLRGASAILSNPSLRRISLELNSSNNDLVRNALAMIEKAGFVKTGEYRSPNVAPNSPIHNFHFERVQADSHNVEPEKRKPKKSRKTQ